jgi:hypothetical protein
MLARLVPILLGVVLCGASTTQAAVHPKRAAERYYKVVRPPLPNPMPRIIHSECPGMGDEAEGCFVPAGEADYAGTPWPTGAVFTDGYRFTRAHELGHAFDATMMDAGERERFVRLAGMFADDEMWVSTYVDEQGRLLDVGESPAEVFADAYASCLIGQIIAPRHEWTTSTGYMPTAHIEREVCGMIARAGIERGTPVDAEGYR